MTDQDRILNLLAQGKITKEEAAELLEALEETEDFNLAKPEVTIIEVNPISPLPPEPVFPELPEPPLPPAIVQEQKARDNRLKALDSRLEALTREQYAKDSEAKAKEREERNKERLLGKPESGLSLYILNLRATSGDITVFSDAKLKQPQIDSEGKVSIQQAEHSWNVDARSDDISVILPTDWGLSLNVQSGDVTVNDIALVQGKIISGDIHMENVGTVDLTLDSGDINIEKAQALKLRVSSGDVNLDDIESVELNVDSGNIHAENIKVLKGQVISGDINVEGIGILDIRVDDGDLNVERIALFKTQVISGDVNAEYVKSLDVSIDNGDFYGNVLLQEGTHTLSVISGDVNVTFLEGSSLSYKASVTSGNLEVTTTQGTYTSENNSYEGRIGEGAAQFNVKVDSGDITLVSEGKKGSKNKNIDFKFDFDFGKTFNFKGFDFGPKQVETPPGLKWIHIDSWAGDTHISGDTNVTQPQANNGHLQENEDGSWKLSGLTDDLRLKIPTDYGVILSVKAGDVTVSHIPFIKGRVFAGDFTATHIGGIDVFVAAGDVSASLLIKEGQHHLSAAAGSLSLKFLKGSSVKYQGSNGFGFGHFGRSVNGIVGEGKANMNIRTLVADVDVVVEE